MISGSADVQTSADVFNTGQFQLPDPAGKAGGACTSALLKVLYNNKKNNNGDDDESSLSWVECLRSMRTVLGQMGYDQVPQLTSSRMIDVQVRFFFFSSLSLSQSCFHALISPFFSYTMTLFFKKKHSHTHTKHTHIYIYSF